MARTPHIASRGSCVLALLVLCGLSHGEEPTDVLRQYVIAQAQGGKLVLPVKTGPGSAAPATILAADDSRLRVSAQGAEIALTWKMLGDDGLYELCQPLVG
ncbi:MAG: hypothetical protein NTW87_23935, partial [Planctomycetota bacterium]|nr:hypothetical protein [Planctomycetota bacterium]